VLVGAGDIAYCDKVEHQATAALLDRILMAHPGATVFTAGDNAYPNGTAEEFANCYEPSWGRFKARTRPSAGNHDYYTAHGAPYYAYFGANAGPAGRGYYSYDLGDWHIISLNSNLRESTGSVQEEWLRRDLAANPKVCTLAYWHHPRFSSGPHGNNRRASALYQALYDHRASVVITGHDHHYERFAPQDPQGEADPTGIRVFIVGTGGASLRPIRHLQPNSEVHNTTTHGVLKLTLRPTSYDWEFIPIAGQTFRDSGSAPCVTASPPPAGTQVTLRAVDGWDSKRQKTLAKRGKLSAVTMIDDAWVEVAPNHFLSLRFSPLRSNGTIQQAKMNVVYRVEDTFAQNALVLQAGGGPLTSPAVAQELAPAVRPGEASHQTVEWDVTAWAQSAARVNDLKLVIRNLDPNGKIVKVDRASLAVTFGAPPASPAVADPRHTLPPGRPGQQAGEDIGAGGQGLGGVGKR
jgi:hypothetical protein